MAEKKQILEEALLDIKKIQEALNANTKEILRSVTKEEIDGIVKESLEQEDYEEEAVNGEVDDTEVPSLPPAEGGESDLTIGSQSDAIGSEDDTEIPDPNEVGSDDQELGMDADAFGGDELDMTGASDDDVIAIYKKLSGDDEIEIVGDEIHLNISEPGEYIVKKGALDPEMGAEEEMGGEEFGGEESPEFGAENSEDDDEMSYEIAMDDDDEESEEGESEEGESEEGESEEGESEEDESEEDESVVKEADDIDVKKPTKKPIKKESTEEEEALKEEDIEDEDVVEEHIPKGVGQAHRLPGKADIGQPRGTGAKNFPKGVKESAKSNKAIVSEAEVKYKKLLSEAAQLKNENEEFRTALKKFRSMLVETVVFNSNLSYVTKLFMEHSTTKDEKKKIIQRFDEEVTNLKESKRLYKTIVNELATRKPMNESVENKIIKEVTTSTSKQLNEANAYVDPSTQRIKDLIKRVENKDKY